MSYIKFPFVPGVYKDDSPLDAEGYFTDTNGMRFVRGKIQSRYGSELASTTSLTGIARGMHTWADASRNPYAGIGTHLRLYLMDVDGNVTDATPVISRDELTNPFSTTISLTTVSVSHSSHGLSADQKVKFSNASAVGGITIDGEYTVTSVTDANTYVITHSAQATSTAGPGGGTVDYEYFLAPGQLDGLGGLGYGTGGFGSGGYGASSSGYVLYPRTWSIENWGQNMLANPRGGGIYELAPNTTASELVTNGDFSAATGWSNGAGWTIAAGSLSATSASTSATTSITLLRGAWHLLDFDVQARSGGEITPYNGTTAIGSAITSVDSYKRVFYSGSGGASTLKFTGSAFTGRLDNVSVKVLTTAHAVTNAPTEVTCIFVTAERILVACGCADTNGNFDPLRVRWTDQEDNQSWTAAAANLAGSYTLSHGSRIVRGLPGRGENLIWTENGLYSMRYTGDPSSVYRFDLIGTGCGLIGPNAVSEINGTFYWLAPGGEFFAYAGGTPSPLSATLRRDVADNLAWVQQDKVYAYANAAWSEVTWIYPDGRDGNECSRYVTLNILENVWCNGTTDRTAWHDSSVFQYPLSVDDGGSIRFEDKGFTVDGAALSWSFETAYFDIGDGDEHLSVLGGYSDADDLQGGYSVYIDTLNRDARGQNTRTHGPFNITNATGKISIRANGQQARLRFVGSDAPSFFRMGAFKLDIRRSGRKR